MKNAILKFNPVLLALFLCACVATGPMPRSSLPSLAPGDIIDTHAHLPGGRGEDYVGAAEVGIRAKDRHRIAFSLLMPPPFPPQKRGLY